MKGLRGIATVSAAIGLLCAQLGCGEDHHEEDFANYGECYAHLREEGRTAAGAFTECDGMFDSRSMYTDNATCVAYYDLQLADTEAAAIAAHCDGLYPP